MLRAFGRRPGGKAAQATAGTGSVGDTATVDATAVEPMPPSLAEVVAKLQYTHSFLRDGKLVGMAFGGARLATSDKPSLTVLLRTEDGRAWGGTEDLDMDGDPAAQCRAIVARAAAGEVGQGMLPAFHALRGMVSPFDDPAFAEQKNAADAMGVALDTFRAAGQPTPKGAGWYVEAERASHAATRNLARIGAEFTAALDPAAIALVSSRRARLDGLAIPGLWEAIDATFQPGAPLRALMEPRPGLARTLAMAWAEVPARLEAAAGMDGVDAFLATRSGLPRRLWPCVAGAVRAVADMPDGEVPGAPRGGDPVVAWVGKLASLPPEWVPGDVAEWTSFLRCQRAVDWARERTGDPSRVAAILGGVPRWSEVERDLSHACDGVELRKGLDATASMSDAFARQVVRPALSLAGLDGDVEGWRARTASEAALSSGRTLAAVVGDAVRWQAFRDGMDAQVAALPHGAAGTDAWPAGLPCGEYRGGQGDGRYDVVVLTTLQALVDEGLDGAAADGSEGLCHDVAARARDCADGRCRVVSLRRAATGFPPERLSTAVIGWEMKGLRREHVVEAHLGPGGGPPGDLEARLLARYVDDFKAGRLGPLDDLALLPVAIRKDVSQSAGYDVNVPGQWHAARDLWRDFLPDAALDMDPEEFGPALLAGVEGKSLSAWEATWEPARFGSGGWPGRAPMPAP